MSANNKNEIEKTTTVVDSLIGSTGVGQLTVPNKTPKGRVRSSSSVGKINLGDTVPGFTNTSDDTNKVSPTKLNLSEKSTAEQGSNVGKGSLWKAYKNLNSRHFWISPLMIILTTYLAYFLSNDHSEKNPLHMFVTVSYQVDDTDQYGKGIKDLTFIFFYMIFFTFLREFLMDVLIRPCILKLNIKSKHKTNRIMEQAFCIIYYGVSGPFGLYIMYHTDLWLFETKTMYRTYPDLTNSFVYKIFYLGQAAFWAQQACVLILQLEKPRKDFQELVFHHIVTLLLIWASYVFHFTKMGLAVYITMDISDFFLALTKTLNYFNSRFTPPVFVSFMFIWIYLRHYINIKILWSVLTEFRTEGNYVLNFATQQYKCWISLIITFILIFALQLVNLYWLFLIFRILYRMAFQGIQKDERSESDTDSEQVQEQKQQALEDIERKS
ncbi:TLC domain-containing protein NDAI_0H01460 [Naumovozyma dairenensis CBS 421]|uniref:TLC domain-containing protein n=1 Tax=Naumovozyma dairenensis (strain ATCC 10597 / BCRC 20456 / CBS 421 / NBRC 0211 / NRRL Y-12639) TaxID=1071378 RepID=G0WEV9_NAUDC|nr:hypothetical protein NDAI_0H01460 [Naumovozyma dairenensis CBS 421]CCD26320.1 hypothetical protein NDAI_0H01460 [Naumovozyma dairenensis CBS 421]